MTNNEILKADLIDIIFDNRNKDYGAYALRKNYPQRMLISLAGGGAILLAVFLVSLASPGLVQNSPPEKIKVIELTQIELPLQKKDEQVQQSQRRVNERVATTQHTSQINIRPNNMVTTTVPTTDDLNNTQPGPETTVGEPANNVLTGSPGNHNAQGNQPENTSSFLPVERQPEYPGGMDAMMRFLQRNLVTPDELQAGERKTVLVKFKIDVEGAVSDILIIQSAGRSFDREVIRICKKMPKWTPGFQNGVNVPIYYQLPVTFIGLVEE